MNDFELPMVALRGFTVLPHMIIHFDLSRDISKKAVERALNLNGEVFLVVQKNQEAELPEKEGLYSMGTVAAVKQVTSIPNNIDRVMVEGISRARLLEIKDNNGEYFSAEIENVDLDEGTLEPDEEEALRRSLQDVFSTYVHFYPKVGKSVSKYFNDDSSLSFLMNQILINTPFLYEQKQQVFEIEDIKTQCEELVALIMNETQIAAIRAQLAVKLKEKIDKNQRDYILREQLEYIRDELGGEDQYSDVEHFEKALEKLKADSEVKQSDGCKLRERG